MRKALVLLLFVGIVLSGLWHTVRNESKRPDSRVPQGVSSAPELRLKQIISQPRLSPDETVKNSEGIDAGCIQFWSEIQRIDLYRFSYPPVRDNLPDDRLCLAPPKALAPLQDDYHRFCEKYLDPIDIPDSEAEWKNEFHECLSALYFLRAAIARWENVEDISDTQDLQVLTDRLALAFRNVTSGDRNTEELISIAERMLELDDSIYGANKAVLLGHLFSRAIFNKDKVENDAYWEKLERYSDRALQLKPEDKESQEIARLIATRGYDPEYVKDYASRMIMENPESVQAHYYLAYSNWKLGDKEAARDYLAWAVRRAPHNMTYQRAWARMNRPDEPDDAFLRTMSFQLNFDFDDIIE